MKLPQAVLAILIVVSWACGYSAAQTASSDQIPTFAIIQITLNRAPGLGMPETKWNVSYELRLTTEADLWEASRSGKSKRDSERVGALLKQGTIPQTGTSPDGQTLTLEIPFDKPTQERLRNQPKNRVNISAGKVTAENIQRLKEQERRSQVFMLYTVVNVNDGKLKKRVVIPISRGWDFSSHPDARFSIDIEISDDSTFSWKSK